MLTGAFPFQASSKWELCENIRTKEPEYPEDISSELMDVLRRLFEKDPAKRITTQELKNHPWFVGIDWNALDNQAVQPPSIPALSCDSDVVHFDKEFTTIPFEDPFTTFEKGSPLGAESRTIEGFLQSFKSVSILMPASHFTQACY